MISMAAFIILPSVRGLKDIWHAGPVADTIAVCISGFIIFREMKNLGKDEFEEFIDIEDEITV